MKKNLSLLAWTASVMLVACMVFASCKDNKSKSKADAEDDEDETELAEDMDDDEDMDDEDDAIDVINARDLILALHDGAHIDIITNEPLHMTEALNELIDEGKVTRYMVDDEPQTAPGVYWEPEYDGNTLYIVGMKNIVLHGTPEDGGFLITKPRYSDVLRFESCKNITIKNLTLGHEETGDCIGDVLVLNDCNNVTVEKCNLFGCGCIGVHTNRSKNISLTNTDIYGCSQEGVEALGTKNMHFSQCGIFNNGCGIWIDEECNNISFTDCNLHDNHGQLFMCHTETVFTNCNIEHHHDDFTDNVKFIDCDVEMDYDEAETLPDIDPGYEE